MIISLIWEFFYVIISVYGLVSDFRKMKGTVLNYVQYETDPFLQNKA